MLTQLLWLWEARLQYERQKAQGLAGLIAILSVILIVWKWNDWFYPLFNKLGIVAFAERIGIVHDFSMITVINVILMVFLVCFFISLICFLVVAAGLLLMSFGASNVGQTIITVALLPLLLPLLFFLNKKNHDYKIPKDKLNELKHLDVEERNMLIYLEQLKQSEPNMKVDKWEQSFEVADKVKKYLNRVLPSIRENKVFLLAYLRPTQQWYLLFPNPLPRPISQSFDLSYKGIGLYGFDSQCMDLIIPFAETYKYYVPALPISVQNFKGQFSLNLDQNSNIEAFDIHYNADFYYIESEAVNKFLESTVNKRLDLYLALHRAHLAFYLFPIVYANKEGFKEGKELYIEESKKVLNADALRPIYESEVREEIIKHAENGEKWAFNWFKGWNNIG